MSFLGKKVNARHKLTAFPLGEITARGWIETQLRREADGMSGHMDELEPAVLQTPFITKQYEKKIGPGWSSELSGAYHYGLVQLAYVLQDKDLREKIARWADAVLAAAEPDGYIGGYGLSDNRLEDYNAWGTNWAVRALLGLYEATGDGALLDACRKALLWFVDNWQYTAYAGSVIIESMYLVYQYTGDTRLFNWAEGYMRYMDEQDAYPVVRPGAMREGVYFYNAMHGVAYGEHVKLPALAYCFNGDAALLASSENALNSMFRKSMQRHGAPATNYEFISPIGGTCETEYCNFATFANTYEFLEMITADAKYGDLAERVVYNGSQGGKKKDGRAMAYLTAPNQIFATINSSTYSTHGGTEQVYAPNYWVGCCANSSVRVLPEFVRHMFSQDASGNLYAACYGPCLLNGAEWQVEQRTNYPFAHAVSLCITRAPRDERTIFLRVPQWSRQTTVSVNGEAVSPPGQAGSFYPVRRVWTDGDVIDIRFDAAPSVVQVDDAGHFNRQPYAIEYGPLLFSMKIEEKWMPVKGHPLNPNPPEGWDWYEAIPQDGYSPFPFVHYHTYGGFHPWSYVLEEGFGSGINGSDIQVEAGHCEAHPWDISPITLKIRARKAKYAMPMPPTNTPETYRQECELADGDCWIELVPYGCTNLRITYFPVHRKG